jgi:hypothetical protein
MQKSQRAFQELTANTELLHVRVLAIAHEMRTMISDAIERGEYFTDKTVRRILEVFSELSDDDLVLLPCCNLLQYMQGACDHHIVAFLVARLCEQALSPVVFNSDSFEILFNYALSEIRSHGKCDISQTCAYALYHLVGHRKGPAVIRLLTRQRLMFMQHAEMIERVRANHELVSTEEMTPMVVTIGIRAIVCAYLESWIEISRDPPNADVVISFAKNYCTKFSEFAAVVCSACEDMTYVSAEFVHALIDFCLRQSNDGVILSHQCKVVFMNLPIDAVFVVLVRVFTNWPSIVTAVDRQRWSLLRSVIETTVEDQYSWIRYKLLQHIHSVL